MTKTKERVNWPLTILLIVGAVFLIFGPLYITVVIALKTPAEMGNILALPKSLNWQNFADAWHLTDYPRKFFNTLFITGVNLVFTILTNSMAAYAITRNKDKNKFFRLMYYYFISAMFIPFNVLMLPLVKQASLFHMDNLFGITFLYIIFGLPMNTFLYAGHVKSLPLVLEEAARIDGASTFQTFTRVVFPLMKPMSATVAILSFMWTWNDFLMPLILLSDVKHQTLQLAQYVFKGQFSTQYNMAFASYLMVLAPILIVYLFCQKWIIAGVTSGSVKA